MPREAGWCSEERTLGFSYTQPHHIDRALMTDSLDIEQSDQLLAYLAQTGRLPAGSPPRVEVLAGGVSNRTVLLEFAGGPSWVLKQALRKLRVAVDWQSSPERIAREGLGIRWLGRLCPPGTVPDLVFEDPEYYLLAMAAVPQPHHNWKSLLLKGQLSETHVASFGRLLAAIHGGSSRQSEVLSPVFEERTFFETLRLEPYYLYSAGQRLAAAGFLHELVAATRQRRHALVHGDYSPKNILVYEGQLVLLDHEVIHWGDPAFDVGFATAHFLGKAHALPALRERFIGAAQLFWDSYRHELGEQTWQVDLEAWAVRHSLGCLLARAVGRSPLEYLDTNQRERQAAAVCALMSAPPRSMAELATSFGSAISEAEAKRSEV